MANDPALLSRALRRDFPGSTVLFDPDRIADAVPELFDAGHWTTGSHESARGGRGGVWFVDGDGRDGPLSGVLRHYRRGGLMSRLVHDRYLWRGVEASRPFREFRLLQALHSKGLPVPRALAAQVKRRGLLYRGDILIERIPGAMTLAQLMPGAVADAALWQRLGTMLGRFQAAGAFHADLNAHNILITDDQSGWLIDFDRGRLLRSVASWQDANLARLLRSLEKLGGRSAADFDKAWQLLLGACKRERGKASI